MLYLTQLIYLREGHESSFLQFEDIVLPLLGKYGGELLLRLRPDRAAFVAGSLEAPYEVHVLRFASEADLDAYSRDEERQRWLHLKDASIEKTVLLRSSAA